MKSVKSVRKKSEICERQKNNVSEILVVEDQAVAELVDDDGPLAADFVGQQFLRQIVEDVVLDGALHRTGTHVGVVAFLGQPFHGVVADL